MEDFRNLYWEKVVSFAAGIPKKRLPLYEISFYNLWDEAEHATDEIFWFGSNNRMFNPVSLEEDLKFTIECVDLGVNRLRIKYDSNKVFRLFFKERNEVIMGELANAYKISDIAERYCIHFFPYEHVKYQEKDVKTSTSLIIEKCSSYLSNAGEMKKEFERILRRIYGGKYMK